MRWRKDRQSERELELAAEQVADSQRRTAEAQAIAARAQREAGPLADRLRQLNASNGFAERLFVVVVRGSR
jgi:hypothetical protein